MISPKRSSWFIVTVNIVFKNLWKRTKFKRRLIVFDIAIHIIFTKDCFLSFFMIIEEFETCLIFSLLLVEMRFIIPLTDLFLG